MIRVTTLHDVTALLGQMLDVEDLDFHVDDSVFRIVYKPLAEICSIEIKPSEPRRREAFEGPYVVAKVRPGSTLREDDVRARGDTATIVRLCEMWAYSVTKEREALEAMKPLLEQQQRERDCYDRLSEYPDRLRTPEEAAEFRDRLGELEERLAAHVAETVSDPAQRAVQAEVVHAGVQKLERRTSIVGIRRSLAMVWAFIMTVVTDGSKVVKFVEAVEKVLKHLPP
jgi:hypothetical protein